MKKKRVLFLGSRTPAVSELQDLLPERREPGEDSSIRLLPAALGRRPAKAALQRVLRVQAPPPALVDRALPRHVLEATYSPGPVDRHFALTQ